MIRLTLSRTLLFSFAPFIQTSPAFPSSTLKRLETAERNYIYVTYRLSADGNKLYIRVVSDEVVPEATKDSATVQKLLKSNLQNPLLFGGEGEFIKAQ